MGRASDKGHEALRRGRVSQPSQIYNVTATTLRRRPYFHDFRAAAACFHLPQVLGDARLLCWVLMPDHAHWLLQLGERDSLDLVVGRLKATSARTANTALGREGALWSRAYHDHALRREEDVLTVARYIVGNPLRAGLVEHLGMHPFWNAVWLGDGTHRA